MGDAVDDAGKDGGSWPGGYDGGLPPRVRRSPSGRIPQWAIDEAFGRLEAPAPWRGVEQQPARKRPWSRRRYRSPLRRRRFLSMLGVALVVCLYFAPSFVSRVVMPFAAPYLPGATVPPPGYEAAPAPLGTPPAGTGSTAFVLQDVPDGDQPFAAYDPCRPVHYVVRPDHAIPGGETLIREAVAAASAATGLQFVDDGTTTESPADERKAFQPNRYGKRWAPVLIAWSTPQETPGLAGDIAGDGGSNYVQAPGQPLVLVAGQIRLDAPDLAGILSGRPDGAAQVRAVIMHEWGHVLGLDHIDDPGQLMHAENKGLLDFAAGDRAGLALLGSGPCVPQL
jgi:hypothetical protein